ncbi:hypothetical protein [Amycolatopsis sp.]|uniref:hypothetical protein n=1 Tax=Amycolatopsis sp. TaxID=37632 RepID=UPI002C9499C3|nr:hypothetical protein [Amycolatopsis sp.]HVV09806.1 hypothetical protein [Amycolatopsis sp.]
MHENAPPNELPTAERWLNACLRVAPREDPKQTLIAAAREVRALVGADAVAVQTPEGTLLSQGNTAGPSWRTGEGAAATARRTALPAVVAGGAALVVPVGLLPGRVHAVILLARGETRPPFDRMSSVLVHSYAAQVAMVLDEWPAVSEFADSLLELVTTAGVTLAGAAELAEDPRVEGRIRAALTSLDRSVALIREFTGDH